MVGLPERSGVTREDAPPPASARRPRVVIIGAGFGGLSAAQRLARVAADITVIDRRNHHLFQPLLYQVATAALSPADIAAPIREILSRQPNTVVILGTVTGIDLAGRAVLLGDRQVPYDQLVIGTGARESYFGHDEWAAVTSGLKSIEDATAMRRRVLVAFERAEDSEGPRPGPAGHPVKYRVWIVVAATRFVYSVDMQFTNLEQDRLSSKPIPSRFNLQRRKVLDRRQRLATSARLTNPHLHAASAGCVLFNNALSLPPPPQRQKKWLFQCIHRGTYSFPIDRRRRTDRPWSG